MRYNVLILALILFVFTSCDKNKEENIVEVFDCEFVQNDENQDGLIDEEESELMQDCVDNAFDSKNEIEENLIGEWIMVGHGEGWLANASQPCAYIVFEEDELIFKFENGSVDTLVTLSWEINEAQSPSSSIFKLVAGDNYFDALDINIFSEELMFGNATPLDGNMYIYKKVK